MGLDEVHERQGSTSPLKYRPKVNWDGFSDLKPIILRDQPSERRRTQTPDNKFFPLSPERSMS